MTIPLDIHPQQQMKHPEHIAHKLMRYPTTATQKKGSWFENHSHFSSLTSVSSTLKKYNTAATEYRTPVMGTNNWSRTKSLMFLSPMQALITPQ